MRRHEGFSSMYPCKICNWRNDGLGWSLCGQTFSTEVLLKNHIEQKLCNIDHHASQARLHHNDSILSDMNQHSDTRCKTCKKNHRSMSALRHHKCVTCCICNRYFNTYLVMKIHFMRHFYKRQLGCPQCRKQFYKATALKKHLSECHGTVLCVDQA